MKKTLLATAIAGFSFTGSALAMDTASDLAAALESMPEVYGNIQYVVQYNDFDGAGSDISHADNGSTIGFKHDHEIAPGITGFLKIELEGLAADDKDRESGLEDVDEAYIGIKGDSFGQIWVGSDDSTYEVAVEQISQFYEVGAINRFVSYDTGEGDLIQYKSPSFSGLTLGAALQINGDSDTKSTRTVTVLDPVVDANGNPIKPDQFVEREETRSSGGKSYPYQLAAMYEVDALELAVAMDSNDGAEGSNENTYGLRASYNLPDLRLTAEYHTRDDFADTYGVQGIYTMGANQLVLSYEIEDQDSGNTIDAITLQALHNLSSNMYVYFEGVIASDDENSFEGENGFSDEQTQANVGAVYYF